MGNHDYSVVTREIGSLNYSAAFAVKWTIDEITDPNLRYLKDLSESFKEKDFSAFHGSPRDPLLEYVYPDYPEETLKNFLGESKILILGHTHVPFERHYKEGMVLNPGSVGQPRDGSPLASYALLNVELGDVKIERVDYEIEKVADRVIEEGFPENLAERLFYGF